MEILIDMLTTLLLFILTLGIVITIHEFGHFYAAKYFAVKILRFKVGFGTDLFAKKDKTGTIFSVGWIPLGGYVQMLDERSLDSSDDVKNSFQSKSPIQRLIIVLAGPFANILLAIVVFWIFFLGGEQRIQPIVGEPIKQSIAEEAGFQDGMRVLRIQDKSIESWTDINRSLFDLIGYSGNLKFSIESAADIGNQEILIPVTSWLSEEEEPFPARDLGLIPKLNYDGVQIISTESNGIAAAAGLMEGDKLIGVNGINTLSMESFISEVKSNPNVPIIIDYERKNIKESVELIPEMVRKNDEEIGAIGVVLSPIISYPDYMNKTLRYNLLTAIPRALAETRQSCVFVISSLRKLIMGDISPKNLSGPIGIARVAGESARSGVFIFIRFVAILSIMLGIMNLLPVPILDGGQALFIMYEMIKGQPVPELVQSFSYRLGVFILLGLMFYATFNDISRFIR